MTISELNQCKNIYILGYGVEGKATHEFLKKFCPKVEVGVGDKIFDPDYLEKQTDYDLVIKSPGIRFEKVRGNYTTATNIFFANARQNIIGITGTKGKSTTATLSHELLQRSGKKSILAGNIGIPMLNILTNDEDVETNVVLELSSYQLEDIAYAPHVSIILNVYEELHNHSSFDEYRKAKFMIAQNAKEVDALIYNPALPALADLLSSTKARKIPFVQSIGQFSYDRSLNTDTVKALVTLAGFMDIGNEIVQDTLDAYVPLPHRLQEVGVFGGIRFVNDSAANHPKATMHALQNTKNVTTIMLGGQDRGFNFEDVVASLKEKQVQHIILFPDTQEKIIRLIDGRTDYSPRVFFTDSMVDAVEYAYAHTPQGTTCLMSPGAPSYSMFSNFPARGEAFINAVMAYAKKIISNT